jgi:hypothetical protein
MKLVSFSALHDKIQSDPHAVGFHRDRAHSSDLSDRSTLVTLAPCRAKLTVSASDP